VRYAVVGMGYIAQNAILPAFAHARRNSQLVALVSGDEVKRDKLGRKYDAIACGYHQYRDLLASGDIDAVYIALPNSEHREAAVLAAEAGIHVLCEKPMGVTEDDCESMIDAAETGNVKLMVAYRLHFERANLEAIELVRSGKLGDPRVFDALFTMQVKPGDIRLQSALGGGVLYDIGIYCINAARYLFRSEPEAVFACSANNGDPRFAEVDEMTSAILRFPGERLATFTCSFGASDVASFRIVGTKGNLRVDPAFEYSEALQSEVRIGERTRRKSYPKRDQFAPELLYFSDCILKNRNPEPSGLEGLADIRIIRALLKSNERGGWMQLGDFPQKRQRPSRAQEMHQPPVRKPHLVHAESPSYDR
jgi:glucose-fructose oxidoreductase